MVKFWWRESCSPSPELDLILTPSIAFTGGCADERNLANDAWSLFIKCQSFLNKQAQVRKAGRLEPGFSTRQETQNRCMTL